MPESQSFTFLLSRLDYSSGSLIGGSVTFYAAGTSDLQTVYLDRGMQSTAANPYTLDGNGSAELFGHGLYRVVVKTAAGVTKYDWDDIEVAFPSGQAVATIADLRTISGAYAGQRATVYDYYSAGDNNGGPARKWAEGAAPGTYVDNGFSIIVPTGGDGSAAWLWSTPAEINMGWCGIISNDNTKATQNTTAIQAAIVVATLSSDRAIPLKFGPGVYYINDTLTIPIGLNVMGAGSGRDTGITQITTTDNTKDVFILTRNSKLSGLKISAETEGGTSRGVYLNVASHCILSDIVIDDMGLGIDVYNTIWCSFYDVHVRFCGLATKIHGNVGLNQYSNNNTFVGCKFQQSLGNGLEIYRGMANTFVGCNVESNDGGGVVINGLDSSNTQTAYYVSPYLGCSQFVNCYIESNGDGGEASIYVRYDQNTEFQNCKIFTTGNRGVGVIDVDFARNFKFSGSITEFSTTAIKTFHLGSMTFDSDLSGLVGYIGGTDLGTGTLLPHKIEVMTEIINPSYFANPNFAILGAGGDDVFASVTESKGSGVISADTSDLIYPSEITPNSLKIVMPASPTGSTFFTQSGSVPASTDLFAVIAWKNLTPSLINSPLRIQIYDSTNAHYWNFETGAWGSDATVYSLNLPIANYPRDISVPFTSAASGATTVTLSVAVVSVTEAINAEYIVYFASVQKSPKNFFERKSGTTANRPTLGTSAAGYQYYDTTVGKPIWWSGTIWIKADGIAV